MRMTVKPTPGRDSTEPLSTVTIGHCLPTHGGHLHPAAAPWHPGCQATPQDTQLVEGCAPLHMGPQRRGRSPSGASLPTKTSGCHQGQDCFCTSRDPCGQPGTRDHLGPLKTIQGHPGTPRPPIAMQSQGGPHREQGTPVATTATEAHPEPPNQGPPRTNGPR